VIRWDDVRSFVSGDLRRSRFCRIPSNSNTDST